MADERSRRGEETPTSNADAPDHDALLARIAELEKELARAERRVARVEEIALRSHESNERHRKLMLDAHTELTAQADRAEAAARTKSAFLANMSHEIRTPMNGILGMLELLRGAHLDDTERHYLNTAFGAARGLLGLLDDVLDYSKIEAGQMAREVIEFDVDALIEEQCGLMSAVAARRGLTVASMIAPEVPKTVRAAGRHLRQILNNLLSNAVKFTEIGSVSVEVGWDGAALEVTVSDTGIGIPPDRVASVFEPFSQADGTITRRYGGSGLGLAIVGQLVRLNGGAISIDSRPGEGARFVVRFPVEPVTWHQAPLPDARRVGLAIGDGLIRRSLSSMLRRLGFEPYTVDESTTPEMCAAALVDVVLGDLDGMREQADVGGPRCDRPWIQVADPWHPAVLPAPFVPERIVQLPLRLTQLAAAFSEDVMPPAPLPVPNREPPGARGSVLVVEDNAINQLVVRKLVERAGYACDVVENGAIALDRVRDHDYDVVLMDVHMPVMDGYTATRRIREQVAPSRRRPPIVALTASAMEEDREPCFEAGMDAFLTKPVDPDALIAVLEKHTRRVPRPKP